MRASELKIMNDVILRCFVIKYRLDSTKFAFHDRFEYVFSSSPCRWKDHTSRKQRVPRDWSRPSNTSELD
jgi:hypothetical protein